MRLKIVLFLLILIAASQFGLTQISYSMKVESGYLIFQHNTIRVDPGHNWQGYYLQDTNGLDVNIINGLQFRNKLYAGIGLGYQNFEGKNGVSVFTDIELLPFRTRLNPLINMKVGYNHIWNQYENGTGTALFELGGGLNYRLTDSFEIFVQTGLSFMQQSLLLPIRIGVRF